MTQSAKRSAFTKNVAWTLIGYCLPLLAAVYCIPKLIAGVGIDRYGLLALATTLVGFLGIFDLGFGRAITSALIKGNVGDDKNRQIEILSTGVVILSAISLLLSAALFILDDALIDGFLSLSPELREEVRIAANMLWATFPFVFLQVIAISVLEAFERFRIASLLKAPISAMLFIAPWMVSQYNIGLDNLVLSIVAVKVVGSIILAFTAITYLRNKVLVREISRMACFRPTGSAFRELIGFGGWVSVSNLIGPILVNLDRFVILSVLGAVAVGIYAAPFEIVSKMSIVGASVSGVLFVNLSKTISCDIRVAIRYFKQSLILIGILVGVPASVLIIFSERLMQAWLGVGYVAESSFVCAVFAIGFLMHGLMQPAFVWIQAAGKPKTTAIIHVMDLVLYLIYLPFLAKEYGLKGAVMGWLIRVMMSFVVLHLVRLKMVARIA